MDTTELDSRIPNSPAVRQAMAKGRLSSEEIHQTLGEPRESEFRKAIRELAEAMGRYSPLDWLESKLFRK